MSRRDHYKASRTGAYTESKAHAFGLQPRLFEKTGGPDGWMINSIGLEIVHGLVSVQGGNVRPRSNLFQIYDCGVVTEFFTPGLKDIIACMFAPDGVEQFNAALWSRWFMQDVSDPDEVAEDDTPLVHPGWTKPVPREAWHNTVVEPVYYVVTNTPDSSDDPTGVEQFIPSNSFLGFNLLNQGVQGVDDPADSYDSQVDGLTIVIEPPYNTDNGIHQNLYEYPQTFGEGDEPDKLTPPGIVLFAPCPTRADFQIVSGNQGTHEKPLCVWSLGAGLIQRWPDTPGAIGLGRVCGIMVPRLTIEIVRV